MTAGSDLIAVAAPCYEDGLTGSAVTDTNHGTEDALRVAVGGEALGHGSGGGFEAAPENLSAVEAYCYRPAEIDQLLIEKYGECGRTYRTE